ncbi:MRC [Mytilus coruscus]|uniref:MRC n=1 Tax=Mytilus coruscus TaxID=42192 RepID=A0A6J8BGI8_MYTCO|nr:MRC [Mytilus coruscus]
MTFFYNDKTGECVLHSKTFKYSQPELNSGNWNMYLFEVAGSRCLSNVPKFLYYRNLDLCYNFNAEHYIDYTGHIIPTCSSYGAELLRIDSQDRQTYVEYILEGRPTLRVAIQGRSVSPWFVWTLFDGSPLSYTNWRLPGPKTGDYYIQIFKDDQWTEQVNFNVDKNAIFLCEIR